MREELVRRNYAETTIRSYLQVVEDFRRYVDKRLDHLGPHDIRRYQVHLLEERKLGVDTVVNHVAALRFFYVKTLKRPNMKEDLPYPNAPKHKRRLPTILTLEEVSKVIDAASNLFHYAMLLTMYSAGLRRSELCRLKVANIDSGRMVIRVERGKGGVDREIPLNQKLLATLREYWRWMRPKTLNPALTKSRSKVSNSAFTREARASISVIERASLETTMPSFPSSFCADPRPVCERSVTRIRARPSRSIFAVASPMPLVPPIINTFFLRTVSLLVNSFLRSVAVIPS
jgi:site-specific recombinase XerD